MLTAPRMDFSHCPLPTAYFAFGKAQARAAVAQPLAAIEMNWSLP